VVSTSRISIGPAGCRINRDYARRGWATKTSHPNWGARDGLERSGRHQLQMGVYYQGLNVNGPTQIH